MSSSIGPPWIAARWPTPSNGAGCFSENRPASPAWCTARMFTVNRLASEMTGCVRAERLMTTRMVGGAALTLHTAVAVMPCFRPSCSTVITATLEATFRMTSLKPSAFRPSCPAPPDRGCSSSGNGIAPFISIPSYSGKLADIVSAFQRAEYLTRVAHRKPGSTQLILLLDHPLHHSEKIGALAGRQILQQACMRSIDLRPQLAKQLLTPLCQPRDLTAAVPLARAAFEQTRTGHPGYDFREIGAIQPDAKRQGELLEIGRLFQHKQYAELKRRHAGALRLLQEHRDVNLPHASNQKSGKFQQKVIATVSLA